MKNVLCIFFIGNVKHQLLCLFIYLNHPFQKHVMPFVVGLPFCALDSLEQRRHHVRLEEDQQLRSIRQLAHLPTDDGEQTVGSVQLHLLVAQQVAEAADEVVVVGHDVAHRNPLDEGVERRQDRLAHFAVTQSDILCSRGQVCL